MGIWDQLLGAGPDPNASTGGLLSGAGAPMSPSDMARLSLWGGLAQMGARMSDPRLPGWSALAAGGAGFGEGANAAQQGALQRQMLGFAAQKQGNEQKGLDLYNQVVSGLPPTAPTGIDPNQPVAADMANRMGLQRRGAVMGALADPRLLQAAALNPGLASSVTDMRASIAPVVAQQGSTLYDPMTFAKIGEGGSRNEVLQLIDRFNSLPPTDPDRATLGQAISKATGDPRYLFASSAANAAGTRAANPPDLNAGSVRPPADLPLSTFLPGLGAAGGGPRPGMMAPTPGQAGGGPASSGAPYAAGQPSVTRLPDGTLVNTTAPNAMSATVVNNAADTAQSKAAEGRAAYFNTLRDKHDAAVREVDTLNQLKQRLAEIGTSGPLTETLGHMGAFAQQLGVKGAMDRVASMFGANGTIDPAKIQEATKLQIELMGDALKSAFPQRITNADITVYKPAIPGPNMLNDAANYMIDNTMLPRAQRDIARFRGVMDLPTKDPALVGLDPHLAKWDDENPLPGTAAAKKAAASPTEAPPAPGAKRAPDGNWYVPDPQRPGKVLRVGPDVNAVGAR